MRPQDACTIRLQSCTIKFLDWLTMFPSFRFRFAGMIPRTDVYTFSGHVVLRA